ncbi:MAG TPA: trypsin-like serine protease [Spirochaetes bacterium]|nr:trypsin-like serine protease [Spirochaetota bacterium]
MKYRRLTFAVFILFTAILIPNISLARLKDYVPIVKVRYHQKTKDTFIQIADYFEKRGDRQTAEFFRSFSERDTWGSGFIFVDDSGNNYIITNRHVVEQSETMDIVFENEDGSETVYQNCPILYVDNEIDVAVVQFPEAKKIFTEGFKIDTDLKTERTEVFSAGYPHLLNRPGWQLSVGIISNEKAFVPEMIDPKITYLIQHTATIDPGNSGGPLLVEDASSPPGYSVIGINTWKITNRENVNFSIPTNIAALTLDKAREIETLSNDSARLKEELIKCANIFSAELKSDEPDFEIIYKYISYAIVGENGWDSFLKILSDAADSGERKYWEQSFFYDPILTMKNAVFYHFWTDVSKNTDLSTISFEGIHVADEDKIGTSSEIRTNFMIGGETTEIVWAFEYGTWRITRLGKHEMKAETGTPAEAGQAILEGIGRKLTGESVILVGLRPGMGVAGAFGNRYRYSPYRGAESLFSYSFGIEVEYALSPFFWVGTGVNYVRKGMYYEKENIIPDSLEYDEHIGYLQVPLMMKFRMGFFIGSGLGLNFRIVSGGREYNTNAGYDQELTSAYYDDIKAFNLSWLLTAGMEYVLKNAPIIVGFDVTLDTHIFSDKSSLFQSDRSRYYTLSAGVFIRYGFVKK